MRGTGIGIDAQLRRRGLLATDGNVAFSQRCKRGAAVAAALRHRHAGATARSGGAFLRVPTVHLAARTTADAAGAGRVVHLVLQVAEGQRLCGQFTVGRVGAGNRAANQVHVSSIHVIATVAGKQATLLAHALVAALGLACAGVAIGIPRITEGHLHAPTHLAVLGHALGHVLQRFDRQRAAGLDVDAVGRGGRAAQRGVTLGLQRDVLAGQRGVLPGVAVRVRLAAAHAGFGIHIHARLRAHHHANAYFGAGIAALATVCHVRLARFQQDVAGRIQAEITSP
ncbi:hypothetical protein D3C81_1082420 [compost metagenome]